MMTMTMLKMARMMAKKMKRNDRWPEYKYGSAKGNGGMIW